MLIVVLGELLCKPVILPQFGIVGVVIGGEFATTLGMSFNPFVTVFDVLAVVIPVSVIINVFWVSDFVSITGDVEAIDCIVC